MLPVWNLRTDHRFLTLPEPQNVSVILYVRVPSFILIGSLGEIDLHRPHRIREKDAHVATGAAIIPGAPSDA